MKQTRALTFTVLLAFAGAATSAVAGEDASAAPISIVQKSSGVVTWVPLVAHDGLALTVRRSGGSLDRFDYKVGEIPSFSTTDSKGSARPDGTYVWELRAQPRIDSATKERLKKARETGDESLPAQLRAAGLLPKEALLQSGSFGISGGAFILDSVEVTAHDGQASKGAGTSSAGGVEPADIVQADDVITQGSLCVGLDCVVNENFGFDTIRLKENNLQINFDDSSASPFPANDWRIDTNENASGGSSYFALLDSTAGDRVVFKVAAGARANALTVDSDGDVGVGTVTPVLDFHAVSGDTPAFRLEQDASSGFAAQTWDIGANEANFFIRDVTGGSKLSFRIHPGASTSSIDIRPDGSVAFGKDDSAGYRFRVVDTPGSTTTILGLDSTGDLTISGILTQGSSRLLKSNFALLNGPAILRTIAALPMLEWSYTKDQSSARHAGPMAEDFAAAFGLGGDDRRLAPSDMAGVALVAIQELDRSAEAQANRIAELECRNQDLEAERDQLAKRLARLEKLVLGIDEGSTTAP